MKAVYLCSTMHGVTLLYITVSKYCEKHETKRFIIIILLLIIIIIIIII